VRRTGSSTLAAAALGVALSAGCTVGAGSGSVAGAIFMHGCDSEGHFESPTCYGLNPTFFAGEPIEDINRGYKANRLLIRLQRTGNRIEINDVVYVDVLNSFEVARCLRGLFTADGTPDWDTRQVIDSKGVCTGVPWCDWSARPGTPTPVCVGIPASAGQPVDVPGPDGGVVSFQDGGADAGGAEAGGASTCAGVMRTSTVAAPARPLIHFGVDEYIRGSFVPRFTCGDERIQTVNLSATAVQGFIDFLDLGSVQAAGALASDFKVDFGSRLQANFDMVLQDDRVLFAIKTETSIPAPLIGGELSGFFDFNLDRGRAAQPFP